VVSNYLLKKGRGWEQGFDVYDDTMNQRELVRQWPERTAAPTTARAVELLTRFHGSKLFMWIHYQDPHGPYTPPGDFAKLFHDPGHKSYPITINRSLSGIGGIPAYQRLGSNRDFHYYVSQYDGEIRYQDEQFKHLIDALKRAGLYNHSLIMFSSDHGEGMGEHNYFFAHGENLYAHQIHVPLILKYGNSLSGRRHDFVQQIDIVPTILNILGDKPNSRFRGRDLRKPRDRGTEIFAEMRSPFDRTNIKFSLVMGGLKLILSHSNGQYELFDLKSDPHENNNLINDKKYQAQAQDLKIRLDRIRKEDFLKLGKTEKPPKLSKEEIENLKSLGYVR
jgi:arylsulfatase